MAYFSPMPASTSGSSVGSPKIGQLFQNTVARASSTTVTDNSGTQILTFNCTGGVWIVSGWVAFVNKTGTCSFNTLYANIATSSAQVAVDNGRVSLWGANSAYSFDVGGADIVLPLVPRYITAVSGGTQPVYVNVLCDYDFSAGVRVLGAYGTLQAIRVA